MGSARLFKSTAQARKSELLSSAPPGASLVLPSAARALGIDFGGHDHAELHWKRRRLFCPDVPANSQVGRRLSSGPAVLAAELLLAQAGVTVEVLLRGICKLVNQLLHVCPDERSLLVLLSVFACKRGRQRGVKSANVSRSMSARASSVRTEVHKKAFGAEKPVANGTFDEILVVRHPACNSLRCL